MPSKNLVLYADDDIDDREIFEEIMISYSDLRLVLFETGMELIEFLKINREQVCYVILDQNMPVMTGVETLLKIRSVFPDYVTPSVLYTTNTFPIDVGQYRQEEIRYIQKPNTYAETVACVQSIAMACRESSRMKMS